MGFRLAAPSIQSEIGKADSLLASGRVVAPGAVGLICQTANSVQGTVYMIYVACAIGTGGLALDSGNMLLREGATGLITLAVSAPGNIEIANFRYTSVAGGAFQIISPVAATAAVPYIGTIIATPVD